MKFNPTTIDGAFLIEVEPIEDQRGSFSRAFCQKEFQQVGIQFSLAQCNLARTSDKGIVRGLHYQIAPAGEQKLIRCIRGRVFDAIIDVRKDSSTYLKTFTTELSAANRQALFIPAGIAHGYQTLEADSDFFYMTDEFYSPEQERGVRYNDPIASFSWPLEPLGMTERDKNWPDIPTR